MRKRLLLPLIIVCLLLPYVAAAQAGVGITLLVETGVTEDGRPICRAASLNDPGAKELYSHLKDDPRIQRAVEAYERVQIEKRDLLIDELRTAGLVQDELDVIKANTPIHPAYFVIDSTGQVNSSSVHGFEMVTRAGGRTSMENVPLVHVAVNSPTMQSKDLTRQARSLTHELGHCMMGVLYDGADDFPPTRYLGQPHWRGKVTDPGLALIEGWAEFCGPYFSEDQSKIIPIDAGDYSFNEDTGELKSYEEMVATEGVVASVFWDMMKSGSGISDPWQKIALIFHKHKPGSLADFERAFLTEYPKDARSFYEIMCRNTFMANISPAAASKYDDFIEGHISRADYVAWLKSIREESWASYRDSFTTRPAVASEAVYEWKYSIPEGGAVYTITPDTQQHRRGRETGGYERYLEYLDRAYRKRGTKIP